MKKQPANVNKKRWAMYAAGAAVAALSGAETAEADIMHVVVPDGEGVVGTNSNLSFTLGTGGAALNFANALGYYAGSYNAGAGVTSGGVAAFIAATPGGYNALYLDNLSSGANVSTFASQFATQATTYALYGAAPGPNSAFAAGAEGFVGFTFDTGGGAQYGWARITFDPGNTNTFTVNEFAYTTDPDHQIAAGQTEGIPEPTSLGLLALGAVGVLANRRRRK